MESTVGVQVAVLAPGNKFVLKPIQLARDSGASVELVSGPSPPKKVIASQPKTLQNGDTVQLAAAPPPSS